MASPLFGVLGDCFVSRRAPMLIGLVGMLISTALFMVATNFYVFLLARLLQGVAGGSVWTLGLAFIIDIFPAKTLGVQMGKFFCLL
jgi:MFS family permease